MEPDVSQEQGDVWKAELTRANEQYLSSKERLDDLLRRAVLDGKSYTILGSLLGLTEAAVRLKARRRGWDTKRRGTRGHG